MKNRSVKKGLLIVCLLTTGLYVSQGHADWYSNQPQQNYNQEYGDFPPESIDQQLQMNPYIDRRPVDSVRRDNRGLSPWDNRYRTGPYPAQSYSYPGPNNYQWPNYGGYDRGRSVSPYGGPWDNRGSNFSPWGNRGGWRGGYGPFGNRGPGDWFNPNRGSMSRNWDDMLNVPSRMGEMPGGWNVPSVSVPNPIDVGEEFSDAAREVPEQMDNFNWNDNRRRGYR